MTWTLPTDKHGNRFLQPSHFEVLLLYKCLWSYGAACTCVRLLVPNVAWHVLTLLIVNDTGYRYLAIPLGVSKLSKLWWECTSVLWTASSRISVILLTYLPTPQSCLSGLKVRGRVLNSCRSSLLIDERHPLQWAIWGDLVDHESSTLECPLLLKGLSLKLL